VEPGHRLPRHVGRPGRGPSNSDGVSPDGELPTLQDYLRDYRLTLQMKGEGLDPEQLARRSVPPSTSGWGRTASPSGSCGFTGSRSTPDTAGTPIFYANASTVGSGSSRCVECSNQLPDTSPTGRCARVAPQDIHYDGRRKDPRLRDLVDSDAGIVSG